MTKSYVNVHKIQVNRSLFSGRRSVKAINFLVPCIFFPTVQKYMNIKIYSYNDRFEKKQLPTYPPLVVTLVRPSENGVCPYDL